MEAPKTRAEQNRIDGLWMERALELADRGALHVQPNPRVGCVIVQNGRMLGEGWHHRVGEAHAEARALAAVKKDDWTKLKEATMYVTLEPCSHFGKTPPCANAVVSSGIPRVVVAMQDPDKRVAGKGIARLRAAGVHVALGCKAEEAKLQNRRFIVNRQEGRPYIVLKWAQTEDGWMDDRDASDDGDAGVRWITSEPAQRLTHHWRALETDILVGARTWRVDSPRLDVRRAKGENPRVWIYDPRGRISEETSVRVFRPAPGTEGTTTGAEAALADLVAMHEKDGVSSILVEGGGHTLAQFIAWDLWDEVRYWTAPKRWELEKGQGVRAPDVESWESEIRSKKSGNVGVDSWFRGIR
jgi:diaminohydroxyphosphoribosylaminopyrimidine deaminase / 5-amino-6-(5-phosphoribosylamino)uracil reductase